MTTSSPADRAARATIAPEASIADAVARLERAETGILLLCGDDRRLLGVLTDGDVRRAILRNEPFTSPCLTIASRQAVTAPPAPSHAEALSLMDRGTRFPVDHLPLVDDDRRIVGLLLRRDLVTLDPAPMAAVIMAGGFGTRLRPLTDHVPKPMLPIGDRPLLARTLERLHDAGIRSINITTHYLGDAIVKYFGDGESLGLHLHYVTEDRPLGTAGALRQIASSDSDGPLLVLNGDILTGLDFRDMLAFHRAQGADATVAVRRYEVPVPYGVIECDGNGDGLVAGLREKPILHLLINAGIYLLEPAARALIPADQRFDMTQLLQRLLQEGRRVVSFPVLEYWIDIGQPPDYAQAQELVRHERS
jgi:dTDP-glucose pyrophosphorylase/CBS domain-containing protein